MSQFSHPEPADIPALLDLWNACLPNFPLSEQLLQQSIIDDPHYEREGCFIVRENEHIIGWVMSKSMRNAGSEVGRFQNRGGIGALCVHPERQRRGIGTQLIEQAENWLQQNGSPLTTLYFPHHLVCGVPIECEAALKLFRQRGLNQWHETYDLKRDLRDFQIPPQVLAALRENPDVEIRALKESESVQLMEFVLREFPGAWDYSTRDHFRHGGMPSDFIVAVEKGVIIGFCHTNDFHSTRLISSTHWHPLLGKNYGGLGPIGIAKAERKRGLGLALCAVAVDDLKKRGVESMCIDWTSLLDFYGKLGFTVWKTYLQGERQIG